MAWTFVTACLLAVIAPHYILGCTPTEELSLEEKIADASILLLGQVVRHYDNPNLGLDTAYTAEMDIFCVLKAPRDFDVHARQNISEAGVVDARCYSVNLEVNKRYIVLGYDSGNEIKPYDDAIEGTPENINKVSQVCGLSPRLPEGIADSESTFCPVGLVDDDGCIVMSNNANNHDHHEDHDGDDHDHDGDDHDHDGDGDHSHDDHHVGHDHGDDHSHDDHHGDHDDHDDDHHSDDHSHHHDDHSHDDNYHDHNDDGEHTHEDHHVGHDHDVDDHDHDDHHGEHDDHTHVYDHEHAEKVRASASVVRQVVSIVISGFVMCFL